MVHFVGAGPGAPDLITLRGKKLLQEADVVIYAGSLVNPVLLGFCREESRILNSAEMTLEQVIDAVKAAEREEKTTVRLHTGDPSVYGAIREQMDLLRPMVQFQEVSLSLRLDRILLRLELSFRMSALTIRQKPATILKRQRRPSIF